MNAQAQQVEVIEHEPARALAPVTPMDMIDRALSSGASVEVLTKLMELQKEWDRHQGRKAFDAAIAAAKAEIPVITKNRKVDFTGKTGVRTNYMHEDLAEITRIVTPILGRHGLSYRFRTSSPPGEPITVTCVVSHRDGHFEENTLIAGRDESGNKNSIQAIGSTVTYLQRYTLKAALGLAASNDDDGRATGDGLTITDAQLADLRSLIVETATDISKVLSFAKVERLEDIPITALDLVTSVIRQRAAKAKSAPAEAAS